MGLFDVIVSWRKCVVIALLCLVVFVCVSSLSFSWSATLSWSASAVTTVASPPRSPSGCFFVDGLHGESEYCVLHDVFLQGGKIFSKLPQRVPLNAFMLPVSVGEEAGSGPVVNVENGVVAFNDDPYGSNIFHFAKKVLSFFNANITLGFQPDLVFVQVRKPEPRSWMYEMIKTIFGNVKTIHDLGNRRFFFKRLFVCGTVDTFFSSLRNKRLFQIAVSRRLGLDNASVVPDRIVVAKRPDRGWTNEARLLEVLKQRNVAYDLIDFATMTFREQVVAMSKAKLLIAPHGAGLSNVMFMPAGGAVIELTSSRSFLPDLYGKIAHACGLRLFLLPGTKTIPGLAKEWKNCQKTFDCRHQFRCPFEVDIPRFDALLQDVLAIQ